MNPFALSGLLIGISSLFFGIFVYPKGRENRANRLWALFCFSVAIWGFGGYKVGLSVDLPAALFWWRITYIGIIFIPVLFYHFVYMFLGLKKKKLLYLIYLFGLFFLILEWTPWAYLFFGLSNMGFLFSSFYWVFPPTFLFSFFVFAWFTIIIYSHYELYKALKKSLGPRRSQIKYFFLATAIGFSGGGTCFLPCFGINLYPIFNFTVPLYPAIMTYAIVKYRLMDIRFVIGRGAVYFLSFTTVVSLALGLIYLNEKLPQPLSFNTAGALIVIFSILLFQFIFRLFEKFASKYFYYTFYSSQQVLAELGKRLTQVLELDKLSSLIVSTLMETMKLDRTVILLQEPETGDYQIQKNIGFREENGISFVKDNFLTFYLEKNRKPVVAEELFLAIRDNQELEEKGKLENLQANMKRIEAALCLPLFIEEKIIGMIVLGNKISKEPYSAQDIELLTTLANQSSIAFQNAKLYSQVENLSENLQEKVDEQTKELRKAYEDLKVLDKAKSEFISMASHQLRTPLSAIKGYISMLVDGSYGKLPEKARGKLKNVFESNERLIRVVNDLLDISKIEMGKMELEKEPTQIEDLLQSCYEEMKIGADKKGLRFIFEKPKYPLAKTGLDPLKFRQAILNLIDNAIRYTQKGEIELKVEKVGSAVRISVKDTGEGLSAEEQRAAFVGFTRGSAGIAHFVEGAGLGLYVAKKFLELHRAKIWVESEGKGKGSTFYVELPIK